MSLNIYDMLVIHLHQTGPTGAWWYSEIQDAAAGIKQRELRKRNHAYLDIFDIGLSVRAHNRLKDNNVTYVGELIARSPKELLKFRGLGHTCLRDIRRKLKPLGLSLEGDDDWRERA